MLHCEARRAARRTDDGRFVPLSEQDTRRWSAALIAEAETELATAGRNGTLGRFQLEAAIQSVHAGRRITGQTDWEAIVLLYRGLAAVAPTTGIRVAHAAAVGEASGPLQGLALLDALPVESRTRYQPYWAVRAHLLVRAGAGPEAEDAYGRAIGLAEDPAVRDFLHRRLRALADEADTVQMEKQAPEEQSISGVRGRTTKPQETADG
jgi:RNA polymerase sigma-70 factor (ECF subfamily)